MLPPVRRHREAGRAVRAGDHPVDRPGRQAGRDRRRARSKPTSWSSPSAPTSIPAATPGLVEGGHEFYTVAGRVRAARRARRLRRRPGRRRRHLDAVQVPAGAERDRAADARLPRRDRGLRDRSEISLVMPLPVPDPAVARRVGGPARRLRRARHRRGIPSSWCAALDPARKVAILADGTEMPYDLFLGVPVHRVPAVVEESGLTVDGWIPVDPLDARDDVSRRLRGRRRDQRRHAQGGRVRRGPGGVVADAHHRPPPRRRASTHRTTAAGSATSSSATTRSAGSTSRSWPATRRRHSTARRWSSRPTRPSSGRAGSAVAYAGSGQSGLTT